MTVYEIISILISSFALVVSIKVYLKNKLYNTASVELELKSQIQDAKARLLKAKEDLALLKSRGEYDPLKIEVKNRYFSDIYSLLSLYNEGCGKYFRHAVKSDSFKKLYLNEIISIFKSKDYITIIRQNNFEYLSRFYLSYCNEQKN